MDVKFRAHDTYVIREQSDSKGMKRFVEKLERLRDSSASIIQRSEI